MARFSEEISKAGYDQTRELMPIPWDQPVDYSLLEKMIEFYVTDKAGWTTILEIMGNLFMNTRKTG